MIEVKITGETPEDTMQQMFKLCSGVFMNYDNKPTKVEVEDAGKALTAQPETAAEPKDGTKAEVEKAEHKTEPKAEPTAASNPINDMIQHPEEHGAVMDGTLLNETIQACAEYIKKGDKQRNALQDFLHSHGAKKISQLEAKYHDELISMIGKEA